MSNIKNTDCKVLGCKRQQFRTRGKYAGYCEAHCAQIKRFGKIRTDIKRNRRDS